MYTMSNSSSKIHKNLNKMNKSAKQKLNSQIIIDQHKKKLKLKSKITTHYITNLLYIKIAQKIWS